MSGYQDSNLGPPAPKAGALTGLRYTPNGVIVYSALRKAEGEGFEPSVQLPVRQFSKLVVSATHPSLQTQLTLKFVSVQMLFFKSDAKIQF